MSSADRRARSGRGQVAAPAPPIHPVGPGGTRPGGGESRAQPARGAPLPGLFPAPALTAPAAPTALSQPRTTGGRGAPDVSLGATGPAALARRARSGRRRARRGLVLGAIVGTITAAALLLGAGPGRNPPAAMTEAAAPAARPTELGPGVEEMARLDAMEMSLLSLSGAADRPD